MSFGSIKMGIAGDDLTGFDEVREEHVLCRTALVGRDDVIKASESGNDVLELKERTGSGITLVTHHHRCPLTIGHRTRSGIGQQVDIHLFRLEHEDVILRLAEPLFALLTGGLTNRFHHLDFPRFSKRKFHMDIGFKFYKKQKNAHTYVRAFFTEYYQAVPNIRR